MATIKHQFNARAMVPNSSNGARYKVVAGSNFSVMSIAFAQNEIAVFPFKSVGYGSGNVTVNIFWYADTASSGDINMGASLACVTPNTDSDDVETKAFATENTATDTHLGTTGQRLHQMSITVSNLDSIAADDMCWLKLRRLSTSDTLGSTDILVTHVEATYSDS